MAIYINHRNPTAREMDEQIRQLEKVPGVCIFIDLINSTGDKYADDKNSWIKKTNNTFNFISILNHFPDFVVKGNGDEMMLYLPDHALEKNDAFDNYYALLGEIYATMDTLVHHPLQDLFYKCKVGIHYCTEVFNITFFEYANDYYGKDIDLSARLMSKAYENRIVMSEAFYQKAMADYTKIQAHTSFISTISEAYTDTFKGVPHRVKYRILHVK